MFGMLIDYNWTETLRKEGTLEEAFGGFEPDFVADMGETETQKSPAAKISAITNHLQHCTSDLCICK
ncbi:hypothetical protein AKJ16_DCAP25250 [Drosera capensis]